MGTEETKELSLEEVFARLEKITGELESGDLPLEQSFESYEAGMKLVREAEGRIDAVEKKIRVLSEDGEE